MEELSKKEIEEKRQQKLREEAEQLSQQREQIDKERKENAAAKKRNKITILSVIAVIIMAIIAYSIYSASKPGAYDDFAKCLKEKGAVMYGAIEWCQYTKQQAKMFGNSFKYVDYRDYTKGPDIKVTPTWIINNERYGKVQSFERLSELTGCKI